MHKQEYGQGTAYGEPTWKTPSTFTVSVFYTHTWKWTWEWDSNLLLPVRPNTSLLRAVLMVQYRSLEGAIPATRAVWTMGSRRYCSPTLFRLPLPPGDDE